jgi:hypothetical protein
MDRLSCINALIATGMTWWAATCLFDDMLAWRAESERSFWVGHFVMLAQEDNQLRKEEYDGYAANVV